MLATRCGLTESETWRPSPETTDYAEGVRRTSVAQFEKLGGKVVGEERYSSDATDFRTQLTKLIGLDPDGLLLAAQGELPGGTIIKQARELGYGRTLSTPRAYRRAPPRSKLPETPPPV